MQPNAPIFQARKIYEKFILSHIDAKNWIRYAKFEQSLGEVCGQI